MPSPTACSARSPRPTTRCRSRGCASAGPTPAASRTSARGSPPWSPASVWTCCAPARRGGRSRSTRVRARADRGAARDGVDPEHEALLADSVGLALLVVLEPLTPAKRLAFVLHDMFAVPFDEIAPSSAGPRWRHASSPAAPAGGSVAYPRSTRSISPATTPSSTRSSPPPAVATEHARHAARSGCRAPGWTVVSRQRRVRSAGPAQSPATCSPTARASPFGRPALVNGAAGVVVAPRGAAARRRRLHRGGRSDRGHRPAARSRAAARVGPRDSGRASGLM